MADVVRYKENTPAVSVIIPIYNSGRYLRGALDSVLGQPFKDIEIICIEDGSEDDSRTILLEYARKDERIIPVLLESNLGICQSRSIGIQRSSGEFVLFLDTDDEYLPVTCARAYEKIVSSGTDILQFGVKTVAEGNVSDAVKSGIDEMLNSDDRILKDCDLIKACFLEHRFNPQLLNKIYRGGVIRRAAQEIEPGRMSYAEDWYIFSLTAYYAKSFASISEPLYVYRIGNGLSTGRFDSLARFERILDEKLVSDAIGRFLGREENAGRYDDVAGWIAAHFVEESVAVWTRDVKGTDFSIEAFKKLLDTYGEDALNEYADSVADGSKREAEAVKSENAQLKKKLEQSSIMLEKLRSELEGIKSSKAYKAGQILAAPVRSIRDGKNKC